MGTRRVEAGALRATQTLVHRYRHVHIHHRPPRCPERDRCRRGPRWLVEWSYTNEGLVTLMYVRGERQMNGESAGKRYPIHDWLLSSAGVHIKALLSTSEPRMG